MYRRSLMLASAAGLAAVMFQAPEGASAVADGSVPVSDITIQGLAFEVADLYTPGTHELTAGEASALNQTRAENLRNNFAPKIKAAMAEFRKANGLAEDAEVAVTSLDHEALTAEFEKYAAEYEFGVRKAGSGTRTPTDPVEREAMRIGKERVKAALNKKGIKLDSVSKEKMAELVASVIAKYPEINEEAKRRVESASNIALDDLELGASA